METYVEVRGISKSFKIGKKLTEVVHDVTFTVNRGEFLTILGPSGSGKSTLLYCLSGLEKPDSGEIRVGDRDYFSSSRNIFLKPEERNIGMVFQSYALWPHMDVFQNVSYPLKLRKLSKVEIRQKTARALELVGLSDFEKRSTSQLSGGQQQRVALGRALVYEPGLLLLDEPLSNLDAKLKDQMKSYLKKLQKQLNVTTIYVTHDQSEALALSDRVAVVDEGRLVQVGSPYETYTHPADPFVAGFVGDSNVIEGTITQRNQDGNYSINTAIGTLLCTSNQELAEGDRVVAVIKPENILLQDKLVADGNNVLANGIVVGRVYSGQTTVYHIKIASLVLKVIASAATSYSEEQTVFVKFSKNNCLALRIDGETRI